MDKQLLLNSSRLFLQIWLFFMLLGSKELRISHNRLKVCDRSIRLLNDRAQCRFSFFHESLQIFISFPNESKIISESCDLRVSFCVCAFGCHETSSRRAQPCVYFSSILLHLTDLRF